jgi:hypothetical protein
LHQFAGLRLAINCAHDRRCVRDLDILAGLEVGLTLEKADLDLELRKIVEECRHVRQQSIVVAHFGTSMRVLAER